MAALVENREFKCCGEALGNWWWSPCPCQDQGIQKVGMIMITIDEEQEEKSQEHG